MVEEMPGCAHFTGNGKVSSESQGIQAPLSCPPVTGSRGIGYVCTGLSSQIASASGSTWAWREGSPADMGSNPDIGAH